MNRKRRSDFHFIYQLALYLSLMLLCIIMVQNRGVVQRYVLYENLRGVQSFFWERTSNIKGYFNLDRVNHQLALDNMRLMRLNDQYKKELELAQKDTTTPIIIVDTTINREGDYSYIKAKIISNSIYTSHNYIIIDKGKEDGIVEDMGIITPNGVVGIVRSVGKKHSYVHSLLNSSQSISVKIENTSAFGPLTWEKGSYNKAKINDIPQHIRVVKGNTVYTSGYSSFFPPDIPIGVVTDAENKDGTHLEISVDLFTDFRVLEHVYATKNNNKSEIDSLILRNR